MSMLAFASVRNDETVFKTHATCSLNVNCKPINMVLGCIFTSTIMCVTHTENYIKIFNFG